MAVQGWRKGTGHFGQYLNPSATPGIARHVAFAKLMESVRRNELLVLASVLAGLVMALFLMTITWATGAGLWAFPGYVAATAFRSLQTGATLGLSWPQITAGFAIHLGMTLVLGMLFAGLSPHLRDLFGLDDVAETPAYGLLGLGFGLTAFATAWWGVLPYANPVMVRGLDPMHFAIAHGVWGLCLGVTRKAWNQTAPQTTRSRASATPQATPATSSHKAPSTPPSGPAAASGATASEPVESDVATLEPDDPAEGDDVDEDETETPEPAGGEAGSASEQTSPGGDDLSPWPAPPEPGDYDEDSEAEGTDNGYASASSGSSASSASSSGSRSAGSSSSNDPKDDEEEHEEEGLAMTEHARRSLRGLTNREPDLPPVHRALDTTLTHVAPGRAVCTIDADERLHDATGAVQSGLLISLAELAAAIAMETVAPEAQHSTVASEIQVEGFVEEGHVVAEAEVTEQAGTTTLAEAEVRDASGKVLVAASFQAATDDGADE